MATPMSVDWLHVVTGWQTEPVALAGLALEVVTAGLYCYGAARLRRSGRRWPIGRTVSFLLGLATLAVALQSGFAGYDDDLLWVHMSQHLAIMMLAAPLLALGAPVRLCLSAGSRGVRRFVAGILHDPSMRMVEGRPAAFLLPLDYYGSMAVAVLTPLYRLSEVNQGFHEFVHLYFLACGLMFWVPMLGQDPARWRPAYPLKVALVAAGIGVYAAVAAVMAAEGQWLSPQHSVADIRRGALVMLVGGVVLTAFGLVLIGSREHRRRIAQARRAAGSGSWALTGRAGASRPSPVSAGRS
jgi:putative membrane protein